MEKICAFFGHRDLFGYTKQISSELKKILIDLIENGVDTFYVGSYGEFDILSGRVLRELKETYPQIQVILILAYAKELNTSRCYFQDFYLPLEVEVAPKRACIVKRNQWVAREADVIISFIKYPMGGAYNAVQYAQKKKKRIIEIQI